MRTHFLVWISFALIAGMLALACGGKGEAPVASAPAARAEAPAPEAAADPVAPAAVQEEGAAEPAPAPEDEAQPAVDDEERAGEPTPTAGARARTVVNREMLAKAYEEVYCAQRKAQTDQILDIYKKYGFDTPKDWTEAWSQTADDPSWQEALTRRIQSARCQ